MRKVKSIKINAILNCSRVILTIVFPILTYPYVSRVLGADGMGKVTFGDSVISYFSLIALFGISAYAIREGTVLKKEPDNFCKFANDIFQLNIFTSIVAWGLLIVALFFPTKLVNYRMLILLQSITILSSPYAVDWLFVIFEDFLYITIRTLILQCISLFLIFVFIKTKSDYYLYALIISCGTSLINILNYIYARKYVILSPIIIFRNIKKHIEKTCIFFFNSITSSVYLNSDVTLLGFLCDDKTVGLYSAATKIYYIVKSLMNAITAVFIPRCSTLLGESKRREYIALLNDLINILIMFSTPCLFGMLMLRKNIILIISGREYLEAATTLGILAWAIGFAVLANVLVNVIMIVQKMEKRIVITNISSALVNIVLNIFFIPMMKQNGAALTTVMAEAFVLILAIYYCRNILSAVRIRKVCVQVIIACVVMILIEEVLVYFAGVTNLYIETAMMVVLGALSYFITLYILRNEYMIKYVGRIKQKLKSI